MVKILKRSYKTDNELYNTIHGLRCVGLILKVKDKKISLSYDKNSSFFNNKEEFLKVIGQYLGNKSNEVNKLIAS